MQNSNYQPPSPLKTFLIWAAIGAIVAIVGLLAGASHS